MSYRMPELESIFKDFLKKQFQKDDFKIEIERRIGRYVSLTSLSGDGSKISLWCETDWTGVGDNPSITPEDIVFSISVDRPASHWKKNSVEELKTHLKQSYPDLCSDDGTFDRERIKEKTLFIQVGDWNEENLDDVNKYIVWFCYSFKLSAVEDYTEYLLKALRLFWVHEILSLDEKEIIRNDKYLKKYIENSNDVLFNHYFVAKVSGNQNRFNEAVAGKYWLMQQRYDVQIETKSAVSNNFNSVLLVHENDILLLVNGSKIFAYGFAQKNKHQSPHQISLRDVVRRNKHEYFEDCEYLTFNDSDVYYEKMGANSKAEWSQYIDVDAWHSYRPSSNVDTSGVDSYSRISNLTIYEVDCVWAIEKTKQLYDQFNDTKTEDEKMLDKIKPLCLNKKNIILQGAPGTGKTYKTPELALSLIDALPTRAVDDDDKSYHKKVMAVYNKKIIKLKKNGSFIDSNAQIGFVTFHQSMDYEDFVEGIKPQIVGDGENATIQYKVTSGIFSAIVDEARSNSGKNYVLIIDEINRGNISKIFGELISLLEADKRAGGDHPLPVILPYSKKSFSVPSNLYIIGTMNTTDRSVGSIDYAVRRRFAFVTLEADRSKIEDENAKKLFDSVKRFLNETKYDMDIEDLMVGHSYFMTSDADVLKMKWQYEILPLLMEYHKDGIINQSPLNGFSEKQVKEVKVDYKLFIEKWPEKKSEETEK